VRLAARFTTAIIFIVSLFLSAKIELQKADEFRADFGRSVPEANPLRAVRRSRALGSAGFLRDFGQCGNEVDKFLRWHHEPADKGRTERIGFCIELASQKFETDNAGFDRTAEQSIRKNGWGAVASYSRRYV
jgi:hypothetical protein